MSKLARYDVTTIAPISSKNPTTVAAILSSEARLDGGEFEEVARLVVLEEGEGSSEELLTEENSDHQEEEEEEATDMITKMLLYIVTSSLWLIERGSS